MNWKLSERCLQEYTTKAVIVFLFVYLVLPARFASHYDYVRRQDVESALVPEVTPNISQQLQNDCEYGYLLDGNFYTYTAHYVEQLLRVGEIQPGGEYAPDECRARFSTAIIVPYRQREAQLNTFLIYMHNFLRLQNIHYRIFLIEQFDQKPFNRAKLFNIGSQIAGKEYGFPCLVLHDVDLLPLNSAQLYVCSQRPRHMCSALDVFRFNLPYRELFGGVVAIRSDHFRQINGMSNKYEGWGGEDDDFYNRLKAHHIEIQRFEPQLSEYTMLHHKPEKPNEDRLRLLRDSLLRMETDGLNSLVFKERERRIHSLFTHILVET